MWDGRFDPEGGIIMTALTLDIMQQNQILVKDNDPTFVKLWEGLPYRELDEDTINDIQQGTGYFDFAKKVLEKDGQIDGFKTMVNKRKFIYVHGRIVADHTNNGFLIGHDLNLTNAGSAYYALPVLEAMKAHL